jgi:hypothetical protein
MSVILFQGLPLTRGPFFRNAQMLVDDETLCNQKESSTPTLHKNIHTLNMSNEKWRRGVEPCPFLFLAHFWNQCIPMD